MTMIPQGAIVTIVVQIQLLDPFTIQGSGHCYIDLSGPCCIQLLPYKTMVILTGLFFPYGKVKGEASTSIYAD